MRFYFDNKDRDNFRVRKAKREETEKEEKANGMTKQQEADLKLEKANGMTKQKKDKKKN